MEFDYKIIIGILIAIVVAYFLFYRKKPESVKEKEETGEGIIYGVMTCPYTVKQVEKYPNYTFVDCSGDKCPDFVTAFPTTKHVDGSIIVGFS